MADDLSVPRRADPAGSAPAAVAPAPPAVNQPRPELYGIRFGLAYGVLAVLLGVTIGLTIVLLGRDGGGAGRAWSDWKPESSAFTPQAKEIAEHVGRQYRLPSGRQIVGVVAGSLSVQNVPVDIIATRTGPTQKDDINVEASTGSVMFVLCGLGQKCAIDEGQASTERHRLLRREALELALYAFKYMDVQRVVAFMPPRAGQDPTSALYFRPQDVKRQLDEPLRRTLLPLRSVTPDSFPPDEVDTVDALTEPRLFNFSFQQAQNGNAVMILDPAL
jgi:hypothetical protein